jgi:hypothetical protein
MQTFTTPSVPTPNGIAERAVEPALGNATST